MKKLLIPVIFTLLSSQGFCQANPDNFAAMADFLPPPPNASSIIKNGMVNINKNTGAPNINIPLYTVKGQKLSTGISLNYSSNGIKVDEISGRVGMGWSLNAGGVITRTMRGTEDESHTRIQPYNPVGSNCGTLDFLKKVVSSIGSTSGYDAEPDLFQFNMNGIAGSFVFDNAVPMQPMMISAVKYKIQYDFGGSAWNFKITTTDGLIYYFGGTGAVEKTKRGTMYCGKNFNNYVTNAWYLTKIEHPNGETITFSYTSITAYNYDNGVAETMTWAQICGGPGYSMCVNTVTTQPVLLSSITNGSTTIYISYTTRFDNDDRLVSLIQLVNNKMSNNVDGSYAFTYDQPTAAATYQNQTVSWGFRRTPYLMNIQESSMDPLNVPKKIHYFVYNDKEGRPPRLSFSQDHWGYFNGKNNTSFVPKPTDPVMMARFPAAQADRSVVTASATKGMLVKIVYPTGGLDQIEYESNEIYEGGVTKLTGGLRVKQVLTANPGEAAIVKRYYYGDVGSLTTSSLTESFWPTYERYYDTRDGSLNLCNYIALHSASLTNLYNYSNAPVSYASVVESNGPNFEGGGTQSKFYVQSDSKGSVLLGNEILGTSLSNYSSLMNARPKEEIVLKKNSSGTIFPIKKAVYTYLNDSRVQNTINGYNVNQKYFNLSDPSCPTQATTVGLQYIEAYDMTRYDVMSRWIYESNITNITYDENGLNPVTISTNYIYNNTNDLQLSKTEVYNSENKQVVTVFQHPGDFAVSPYTDMVTKNILIPVVNSKETIDLVPTVEIQNDYINAGSNNYVLGTFKRSVKGNAFTIEGTINSYDAKGNILQYTDKLGIVTAVVWGYNNFYPVAKVTGATYVQAIAQLTGGSVTFLQGLTDAPLLTELHKIRTGLPAAQVTTYSYRHLTGVTSITDMNNKKNSFEYDSFSRLMLVRDQDGNVIKKYEYNYTVNSPNAAPL